MTTRRERARAAAQRGAGRAREAAMVGARRTGEAVGRAAAATRATITSLPPGTAAEVRGSLLRLRRVRTPSDVAVAFEAEVAHLFSGVAPLVVQHPLPIRRVHTARAVVGAGAGSAAVLEEIDLLAAAASHGTAIPVALPVVIAAAFGAVALEATVAASLRVNTLRAGGIEPHPQAVAREVAFAMAGRAGAAGSRLALRVAVNAVARRSLSRVVRGVVPVAGAAWASWDAQRTIGVIATLPVTAATQNPPIDV